ncbi:signal peptide protein [Devosia limi DSM 17137]|uniref:Signal peptide protein n=2 Tax=Devosia TaxID=46913 RepID=A0A0F5L018_9HYPH|nr:signal peptide protein [Devosia limi DSM 17137]SHE52611.1 protein of unknown function [Devosia limi DSM 17137]
MKTLILAAVAVVALALPAAAQDAHAGHGAAAAASAADTASTAAYKDAADAMHADMAIDYTGSADIDFVRGMIPHHQGAIAMAKVVLEHGADAEIRKLAEEIITAQEGEIAWMQDWLAKNGG